MPEIMERKKQNRFRSDVPKNLYRVPMTITREMDNWCLSLSAQIKASGGNKLPRSYVVRALIGAAMKLHIDIKGIRTEKELEDRIREAMKNV